MFTKHIENDILIVQIYVDDIIFKSTNEKLCKDFESCMKEEFEMFMVSELNYFLGLQIKQRSDGIFINQAKYTKELTKKFELEGEKISKTPMATTTKLDKDEQGINVDIKLYRSMISSLLYLMASRPDIMFGSTNEKLCKDFESCIKEKFEMSMMDELNYFLGLQIKQRSDGIFINQAKYTKELIKKFGLEGQKLAKLPWLPQQNLIRMNKV